jgi:hypothetical protein
MFIGHAAVGFASKAVAPRASLGVLLAAPFLLDLLWPVFLLTGLESARIEPGNTVFTPIAFDSYPWSHSLLMAILWGALFGFLVHLALRSAAIAAVRGHGRSGSGRSGSGLCYVVCSCVSGTWESRR